MEDNAKIDNGAIIIPQIRNRKRYLELSDEQNEENILNRKQNLFSEWQETLRSIGVSSKKGFTGNDSQYNDMIDQGLADNFEDSLSGLGVDITTVSYNMSDAMMALPNINGYKVDPLSPTRNKSISLSPATESPVNFDDTSQSNTTDGIFKLLNSDAYPNHGQNATTFHHLLHSHIAYNEPISSSYSGPANKTVEAILPHSSQDPIVDASLDTAPEDIPIDIKNYEYKFQYILGAATSVAVRINEESLTYLNQGQSYEVKMKKLGDITSCQGRLYHSRLRIRFQERRMQFMEKQHIAFWKSMRPGERILEIDVPLSYGISDLVQDPAQLNVCEFDWDPTKEAGVYIKVNCISTEFTPKKHGGEKGVPLKLVIETFAHVNSKPYKERLHVCGCQLKVFKLKGADRKHKQDREKLTRRVGGDEAKYQRQCDCTILQEISSESVSSDESPPPHCNAAPPRTLQTLSPTSPTPEILERVSSPNFSSIVIDKPSSVVKVPLKSWDGLSADASASETELWLASNRFPNLISVLANFRGSDVLQLSRSELIEICGLVDGIRLFNTLRPRNVPPLKTFYVRCNSKCSYVAVYLYDLTLSSLASKIASVLSLAAEDVGSVLLEGPAKIRIRVTDEVVKNMKDEAAFTLEIKQDSSSFDKFEILFCLPQNTS